MNELNAREKKKKEENNNPCRERNKTSIIVANEMCVRICLYLNMSRKQNF